jgi:NAD(P)-dependent dehydrogenase (short-subunit alcohol dehydrogenase family)
MTPDVIAMVKFMTPGDIIQTVVLTGPSRGLGRDTALAIAARGHRLVLLGRPSAGFDAVCADALAAGAQSVVAVATDFASIVSVRAAAGEVRRMVQTSVLPAVDVVIGSAGVQQSDRTTASVDGIEVTFAVNVLANHLLVTELQPVLVPAAHVVLIGSVMHRGKFPATFLCVGPKWEPTATLARPGGKGASRASAGQSAYSTSKLAVNHLVHELQRRLPDGVRVNVYDPGLVIGTGIARELAPYRQWVWNHVIPRVKFPGVVSGAHSAEMVTRFALGDDHPDLRAGYVEIGELSSPTSESTDPAREAELFEGCSQLAGGVVSSTGR